MKKVIVFVIIFMLPVIGFTQSASVTPHPEVSSAFKVLELWLDAQIAHLSLPGITAGIVLDQEQIWSHSFGFSDGNGISLVGNELHKGGVSIASFDTSVAGQLTIT